MLVAALLASACGGKVVVDGAGGGATGTGGTSCGHDGLPLPASLKACATDGDCTIRFVTLDCCGTQAFVGVASSQTALFASFEERCDPIMPVCGCDPGPALTDDGHMTAQNAATIHVACSSGLCETFAP